MTERDSQIPPLPDDAVAQQVQDAVEGGTDVRGEVERITRDALLGGRFDPQRIRRVVRAVGEGATSAANRHPDSNRQAVTEALDGLQAALAHSAEQAKLSIEEAAGRVSDYSRDEVKRALDELHGLETTMLDALQKTAAVNGKRGGKVLGDLVEHARQNGTRLGADVSVAMQSLAEGLPAATRETLQAGLDAMREGGARAFEAASGVFDGLADALRARATRGRKGPP